MAKHGDSFTELLEWLKERMKRNRQLLAFAKHEEEYGDQLRSENHGYQNVMMEISKIRRRRKKPVTA